MLGTIVDFLHASRVPFRLASYPSPEEEPFAAHALPPGGILVDTRVLRVDGQPVLAVFPADESVDLAAVTSDLGGLAVDAGVAELPRELEHARGTIPPFGQLFGVSVLVDTRVASAAVLVFRAFSKSDFFEIPYDDYARLEQPRLAPFASLAELATPGLH